MRAILSSVKVYHAIDTSKRCAVTLIAVGVQLLLREDVAAVLSQQQCQTRSSHLIVHFHDKPVLGVSERVE